MDARANTNIEVSSFCCYLTCHSSNDCLSLQLNPVHFPNDFNSEVRDRLPGIVVPQQTYVSPRPGGHAPTGLSRLMFFSSDGRPGVRVQDVINGTARVLDATSIPTLSDKGARVTLRICVCSLSLRAMPLSLTIHLVAWVFTVDEEQCCCPSKQQPTASEPWRHHHPNCGCN